MSDLIKLNKISDHLSEVIINRPEKLNAMTKSGEWDKLAAQIPDDLLELFCAIGRHDEIAKNIQHRFGKVADVITTGLNEDFPPDLIQDIQKIQGSFVGFNTD